MKKKRLPLTWGTPEGKDLLQELVAKLEVDIFATNHLSWNYDQLGISYEALKTIKAGGLPVFGPNSNEVAYDHILQARSGLMELTGEADESPCVGGSFSGFGDYRTRLWPFISGR